MTTKINTSRFFFEYKGHPLADIAAFHQIITAHRPDAPIVYLAGDSSLDNKHWLPSTSPSPRGGRGALPTAAAPEIYNLALEEPYPKADVAFWLNHRLGPRATALNLAVEASLLRERSGGSSSSSSSSRGEEGGRLLAHDVFIRDHITPRDVLVVSVGGNDIAMKPTALTALHMLWLAWLTPLSSIRGGGGGGGGAWALRYFVRLFRTQTEAYISKMVARQRPRAVIVCMVYYPLEAAAAGSAPGWADAALRALGYNTRPERLQAAIRSMYEMATREVRVDGVARVRACALFEALDGKDAGDYEERVEPSVEGGRKMAELIGTMVDEIIGEID